MNKSLQVEREDGPVLLVSAGDSPRRCDLLKTSIRHQAKAAVSSLTLFETDFGLLVIQVFNIIIQILIEQIVDEVFQDHLHRR